MYERIRSQTEERSPARHEWHDEVHRVQPADFPPHLGFGRIVVSEIEAPNMLANPV